VKQKYLAFLALFGFTALMLLCASGAWAQTTISGEVTGTVADPSGAYVPNVPVILKNLETGDTVTTTTGDSGNFRFSLLRPGQYSVSTAVPGFERVVISHVTVSLGQVTNVPIILTVGKATETVEVTAAQPLLETENGNITANFSQKDVELLPSPGQDLTNYALSAPGVVLSTGSGYGNFTANGLPGTSNLYTVNGGDMNDPFNNLNNSGSSNNMLGTNEVQEVTVVTNGYTGEYGRAAGANMNITTKSGSNQFHGDATWWWNGRYLNANDFFSNANGAPRPFANSNQWGGDFGGPIKKDKLFFYYDNEGLRYVLPNSVKVFVPSPQFQAATIANLNAAGQSAEVPFYQKAFALYNGANGISRATPVSAAADPALGCGDLAGSPTGLGGTFGVDTACALTFQGGNNNLNKERLMSIRVDYVATTNDKLSFRYWQDRGLQPTFTDPINPIFNTQSNQPQDAGQMTYTRVINPHLINQFIVGAFYYSAVFNAPNFPAAVAASPFQAPISFFDGAPFNNIGGTLYSYPQGRRVSQGQIVDDVSWTRGDHDLKFGVNLRLNRFTDLTPFRNTTGRLEVFSMTSFFNGVADRLAQRFETTNEAGFRNYSLGLYAQDVWRATAKLKLTLSLRADRNSNESCPSGCYSRFSGSFLTLNHDPNSPYNAAIQTGLKQGFPNLEAVVWEPRIGFAYSARKDTVVRGGFGVFSDLYPGQIMERFVSNPPFVASFNIDGLNIAPGVPGSAFTAAKNSNAALVQGFTSGGTLASIKAAVAAAGGTFTPPTIASSNTNISNPKYLQWNFEVEHSFGSKTTLALNYVGNHGYDLFVVNPGYNTFCRATKASCIADGFTTILPGAASDPRFNTVTELTNHGISNYHGFTSSLTRRFTKGLSGQISYTWSHSLDDVSNGGLQPYSLNNATSDSLLFQIDPNNLRRLNYGNSDYDFRHDMSASYIWELPLKASNNILNNAIGGWTIAEIFHARSGQPFSVVNSGIPGSVLGNGSSEIVLGTFNGGGEASCNSPDKACLSSSQFTINGFGNVPRNSFRGPMYFDTDLSIYKAFKVKERLTFTLGAIAYNVLNHPNFANPDGDLADGTFGQIIATVSAASSPYGNFQSAAASGRILQLMLKVKF
jgi:Carboxypeptidase regulatory-like domain/TonB-dependent Receptor Plug Domain